MRILGNLSVNVGYVRGSNLANLRLIKTEAVNTVALREYCSILYLIQTAYYQLD